MPNYTWQCQKCKMVEEVFLQRPSLAEEHEEMCTHCDIPMQRVLMGAPAVHGTIDNQWRKEKQDRG
jgi:predicted nucleic acid-binding Zn ribbon protein